MQYKDGNIIPTMGTGWKHPSREGYKGDNLGYYDKLRLEGTELEVLDIEARRIIALLTRSLTSDYSSRRHEDRMIRNSERVLVRIKTELLGYDQSRLLFKILEDDYDLRLHYNKDVSLGNKNDQDILEIFNHDMITNVIGACRRLKRPEHVYAGYYKEKNIDDNLFVVNLKKRKDKFAINLIIEQQATEFINMLISNELYLDKNNTSVIYDLARAGKFEWRKMDQMFERYGLYFAFNEETYIYKYDLEKIELSIELLHNSINKSKFDYLMLVLLRKFVLLMRMTIIHIEDNITSQPATWKPQEITLPKWMTANNIIMRLVSEMNNEHTELEFTASKRAVEYTLNKQYWLEKILKRHKIY
jgi:hypothetical protein